MARRPDYSSNNSLSLESHAPTPLSLEMVSAERSFPANRQERSSMSPLKSSEPIAIPQSFHQSHRCASNSERSSNFSTPEDNFGSLGKYVKASFPGLEPLAQSVSLELGEKLPPIRSALLALAQIAFNLKLEVEETRKLATCSIEQERATIREVFETDGVHRSQRLASTIADLKSEHERAMKERCDELEAKANQERDELMKIIEHERYLRREKEGELGEQTSLCKHLNEQIVSLMKAKDDLHADCMRMEQERKQLNEQLEIESSVDYLSIELKAMEQLLKRSLTENEIREIKAEIDKRKTVKVTSTSPEQATALASGIAPSTEQNAEESHIRRGEYEKAYKVGWNDKEESSKGSENQRVVRIQKKMELIVKGVEEKKHKEMAHMRDELEEEIRTEWDSYVSKMKSKVADLEQRIQLYESTSRMETSQIIRVMPMAEQQALTADNEAGVGATLDCNPMTQPSLFISNPLQESCMELTDAVSAGPSKLETFSSVGEDHLASVGRVIEGVGSVSIEAEGGRSESVETPPEEPQASDTSKAVAASSSESRSASRAVQTHIQLRDMRSMFSLVNIHVGCSVIIHWRNDFKTYVVQCNSPTLHFVKSACLSRFGVDLKSITPPSTLIGVVTAVDTCKIVKEKNRFNLPVETKISQVSVEPLS